MLMSENDTKYNWYPNMIEVADKMIGVLYLKDLKKPYKVMFSSADRVAIDNYFEKVR